MTASMPVDFNVNPSANAVSQPSASDPTTAGNAMTSNAPATGSTKIGSLGDLKRKAPKVYKMMMQSIQEMMRRDMQHHQENLKKTLRGNN